MQSSTKWHEKFLSMVYPCVVMVPAIIWVVTVVSLTQYWPGKLLDYWTLYCAYEITNFRSYMFPGTVPSQATGWCGAAFPADSPRFPEELQAGQVLCHLPRKRHGWRPPSEGWWSCAKGAWCNFRCGSQKDHDQVQDIHWVASQLKSLRSFIVLIKFVGIVVWIRRKILYVMLVSTKCVKSCKVFFFFCVWHKPCFFTIKCSSCSTLSWTQKCCERWIC